MLGASFPDTAWPAAGEIDIIEVHQFFSDINTAHFTIHWLEECIANPVPAGFQEICQRRADANFQTTATAGHAFFSQFTKLDEALSADFHIYELEWNERSITGKIDGVTYFTASVDPDTMSELLESFFLILNVAVDGSLGGPPEAIITTPQEMLVDWVRVYQKPKPEALYLAEDSPGVDLLPYREVINSVVFGGNSVETDLNSTAVPPTEGDTVIEFNYTSNNAFFSGAAFRLRSADLSSYAALKFALDASEFQNFDDISIEILDSRNTGGALGKNSVQVAGYEPTVFGNWDIYEIPFTAFKTVNLDDIVQIGFWNPKNPAGNLIAGKLYVDAIRFVQKVALPLSFEPQEPTPTFTDFNGGETAVIDNPEISANNNSARVVEMVKDGGPGGSRLALELPIDFSVSETLTLDVLASRAVPVLLGLEGAFGSAAVTANHAGSGDWEKLSFDFGGMTAGLGDVRGVELVFDDGVVGDAANNPDDWIFHFDNLDYFRPPPLPRDADGDGFVYMYRTDPAIILDLVPDTDYGFSDFGSGSTFNGAFDGDPDFNPVFAVTSGNGFFIELALLALTDFEPGFAEDYANLVFKIKGLPTNNVLVAFSGGGKESGNVFFDLNDPDVATDVPGTTGWKQVTIPLSSFPDRPDYINFAILGEPPAPGTGPGPQYTFLITDIAFTGFPDD